MDGTTLAIIGAAILVMLSGLFSGLNLGLMSFTDDDLGLVRAERPRPTVEAKETELDSARPLEGEKKALPALKAKSPEKSAKYNELMSFMAEVEEDLQGHIDR